MILLRRQLPLLITLVTGLEQLRREVFPVFGDQDVASIGYPRIEQFVRELSERGECHQSASHHS